MNTFSRQTFISMLLLCVAAAPGTAATITLDAVDSGHYTEAGAHVPPNQNYLTGLFSGSEYRSFFVFDLSSVTGAISSATLRLFNPEVSAFLHGYVSPDPTETLNIFDVTTSASDIVLGIAGVAGFGDLGSGTLFGTRTVSAADNGTVVEIALNLAALTALNAATGQFVLGGALSTISGPGDQHVFGFSMTPFVTDTTRQLVLQVADVPEPSIVALGAVGALLCGAIRRRQVVRLRRVGASSSAH